MASRIDANGNSVFYLWDGLGNALSIIDGQGNIVQSYEYSAYGEVLNGTDSVNAFRFVGRYSGQQDDATGLTYFWNRWYDSNIGRWVSEDPTRQSGGLNLYEYGANAPSSNVDTSGTSLYNPIYYRGVPPDATKFTAEADGATFDAPSGTNFLSIYNAGVANGTNYLGEWLAVGTFGSYDFQRDAGQGSPFNGTFVYYLDYIHASNFAVGDYTNGMGLTLSTVQTQTDIVHSANGNGSSDQWQWITDGWNSAQLHRQYGCPITDPE